jgi:hypothetical protein
VPVVVVERRSPGAAGASGELILGAARQALGRCEPWVTFGDTLVGFLADEPVPARAALARARDPLAGLARVRLLHCVPDDGLPRRVPAAVEHPDRGRLRFLVEPAADIDRWPLRCELLDDPYFAASLGEAGLVVRTTGFVDDPLGALPEGLTIGELRLFGYRLDGGRRVVPIGLFVAPRWPAATLHHVVVWVADDPAEGIAAARTPIGSRVPVQLARLPVPGLESERLFATSAGSPARSLPSGAAVVVSGRLVGAIDAGGWGFGVVAPFGAPGRRWPLTFLPDEEASPPLDLVAVARSREDGVAELEVESGTIRAGRGQLFTAAAGPRVPAGIWVGPARVDADGRMVVEHVSSALLAGPAELCDVSAAGVSR